LLCFGLMGIAIGAFLWSASPWFVTAKQWAATWLVEHDIMWPLMDNAPWFILTHYPDVNDSFSWLDGAGILMFVVGATIVVGGSSFLSLWLADRLAPAAIQADARATGWIRPGVHKLAQALIPSAGIGVFLGLSATTVNLLKHEGVQAAWAGPVRFTLLTLAVLWTLRLFARLLAQRQTRGWRKAAAWLVLVAGLAPFCMAWVFFFAIW
jgi:hypothetical protein